jgi:hypothetical protein
MDKVQEKKNVINMLYIMKFLETGIKKKFFWKNISSDI